MYNSEVNKANYLQWDFYIKKQATIRTGEKHRERERVGCLLAHGWPGFEPSILYDYPEPTMSDP